MTKVAVILSGCGHMDGAEIRESVLTLLYLDKAGAEVECFAPDIQQAGVVNHLTGKPDTSHRRNVLEEAARIARGKIKPLTEAKADDFDAVILPGGFGAAKNLSDFAAKGKDATALPELSSLLQDFAAQKKPIGAICIAPAVLAVALGKKLHPLVTIGEDKGTAAAIEGAGGKHQNCATDDCVVDEQNLIATCSAYMRDDRLHLIAAGIEKVVENVLAMAAAQSKPQRLAAAH